MTGQLNDGVVAAADRALDVVEADLDRPVALPVIGHPDTSDPARPLRPSVGRDQAANDRRISDQIVETPIVSVAG